MFKTKYIKRRITKFILYPSKDKTSYNIYFLFHVYYDSKMRKMFSFVLLN